MSGELDVREATLADLDGIVDLHTRARNAYYGAGGLPAGEIVNPALAREQRDGWKAAISAPHKRVLSAMVNGLAVGVLAMGPPLSSEVDARRTAQLYQIHVAPRSWGRGIGSTLHALFVRHLETAALPIGILEVWERNARARAFYARHGWQPDGTSRPGPAGAPYLGMRLSRS